MSDQQILALNKAGMVHPDDERFMPNIQPPPKVDPTRGLRVALEAMKKNPKAKQATVDYLEKQLRKLEEQYGVVRISIGSVVDKSAVNVPNAQ